MSSKPSFTTPQAAEQAFYAAFEQNDLDAMLEVWAPIDTVLCIHPGGERLCGLHSVAESWRQIFGAGSMLSFEITLDQYTHTPDVAVHSVQERILVDGSLRGVVLATNVYERLGDSWRMVSHHASPAPRESGDAGVPSQVH
jgi:ketosteroid isomerase-like protein